MLCTTLNFVLWDCTEILKVDTKQLWYWYLIKRTTNSGGIRTNWIDYVLYTVLLNLHIFAVLNIYFTEPCLGPVQRIYVYLCWQSHGPLIRITIMPQFFSRKIPEKVLLNGAISICRRFSKVSHRFEAKMCSLSLLASLLFEYIFFTLWHIRLVLYSKWKSSITAPPPLTTISPSKRDSTLLRAFLLLLKFEHQSFVLNRRFLKFIFNFFKIFMRHYWAAHIHFQSSNIFTWKKEKPYACFLDV